MTFHAECNLAVCGLSSCFSFCPTRSSDTKEFVNSSPDHQQTTWTADDGLRIIAAALDTRVRLTAKRDCSHLVHAIYVRAGFPYTYVRSSDLYRGADEFQRVIDPQPGDLVVWRGHVGIVVYPAQLVFFSAMRSGLGTDGYASTLLEAARPSSPLSLYQG